uniref:Uncharacterized protein n=2 Tax=Clytia hemisphaerica TaxID=252671 RepID=A0A7M5VDK0_9CNID
MDHFFKNSFPDKCTLGADKSFINRRNVATEVKKHYSAVRSFLDVEFKARVIAAGLDILEISDVDEMTKSFNVDYFEKLASPEEKRRKLESICTEVVDNYILRSSTAENYLTKKQVEFISVEGKFKCNLCDKLFEFIGKSLRTHLQKEHQVEN